MQTTIFNLARYPVRSCLSGQLVSRIPQVKAEVHLDMLHSHGFIDPSPPAWKLSINPLYTPSKSEELSDIAI